MPIDDEGHNPVAGNGGVIPDRSIGQQIEAGSGSIKDIETALGLPRKTLYHRSCCK